MALVSKLRLPDNWRETLDELLQQTAEGPDPEMERARLRGELRRLREGYRKGLYEGEEFLFWREAEGLQEQIAALESQPPSKVEQAARQILSLKNAWELATKEERSELVHMLFERVGCNLPDKRITWVKPHQGFEPLFQMLSDWEPDEKGRYEFPAKILGEEKAEGR